MTRLASLFALSTLLVASPAAGTSAAQAAEPFGLSLMRPMGLAAWDYGPSPPTGWTMEGGTLRGTKGAAPLLSGFTFGDFELRLEWSAAEGAALHVLLPDVPRGERLRLTLGEGEGCGRLDDGGKQLLEGTALGPAPNGKTHSAAIRRAGATLAVSVDGRPVGQIEVKPGRRFGLGLSLQNGDVSVSELRLEEPPGEPIFNGRDLDGWWCPDNLNAWHADAGELVLKPGGGNYLRTKKDYGNFTLSLEYLIVKGGNSGIGIRTPQPGWPSGDGMEMQIEDVPGLDKHKTMAIYGNEPPLARADLSEQWNRALIKADGRLISAWVNGQLVQHCDTARHPELKHRNLKGWIGFQDHGGWIRFRNICVLEAPDGLGLDAWSRPRPPEVADLLLDRMMNPERLSVADGVRAGTAAATVSKDSARECVLADLAGPGAVVRIARSNDQGRLAFYFDGEAKPRLQCKPGDLWHAAPMLSEYRSPVLTCLTYAKGLKVVLQGAREASYTIDYVTLPEGTKVESFTTPEAAFPRGWLPAIDYRLGQAEWGVIRQYDPAPRHTSPKKTIAPGRTERLVHVDGAGVVEWLQLQAPKQLLDKKDLWLEVTVDGEKSPAIAAPARFFFPGLAGQGNYKNFLMLDRGGCYFRLAMPFAGGISVSARNAGKKPLGGVGVALCVAPAAESDRPGAPNRMRLRGAFLPAGEKPDALAAIDGSGRWVGLVCEGPEGATPGIAAMSIDGRDAEGWKSPSLDAFLGQAGAFRGALSGRNGMLAWRYLLMEAVDFRRSLELKTAGDASGNAVADRLVLLYAGNPSE